MVLVVLRAGDCGLRPPGLRFDATRPVVRVQVEPHAGGRLRQLQPGSIAARIGVQPHAVTEDGKDRNGIRASLGAREPVAADLGAGRTAEELQVASPGAGAIRTREHDAEAGVTLAVRGGVPSPADGVLAEAEKGKVTHHDRRRRRGGARRLPERGRSLEHAAAVHVVHGDGHFRPGLERTAHRCPWTDLRLTLLRDPEVIDTGQRTAARDRDRRAAAVVRRAHPPEGAGLPALHHRQRPLVALEGADICASPLAELVRRGCSSGR